jgi:hypothetical protein
MLRGQRSWLRRFAALALLFLTPWWVLYAPPAQAAFEANDAEWQGSSELLAIARAELGSARVVIVGTLDYEALKPEDGVLLLHPEVEIDREEMGAFLAAGGRLGVLDDRGKATTFLAQYRITRVAAPLRPALALRDNPNLAIAVPYVQQVAGQEQNRHPIVRDVDRVVTNHPTALSHPDLTMVLQIPAIGEPNATLAVTGVIGKRGRLFAMGDPSALINLMLRYPGNRSFAKSLVRYLVEKDEWGERGGKLYLVTNGFRQRGHFGGVSGVTRDLRDAFDAMKDALREAHEGGFSGGFSIVLAAMALAVSLVWAFGNALRIYRRYVPRYALATPLVAQGGAVGRAAVLASPTTERALVLAEIRSALVEALSERTGADPRAASPRLIAEVEAKGVLGPEGLSALRALLFELDRGVQHLQARQKLRVSPAQVEVLHQKMMEILSEIDQRRGV